MSWHYTDVIDINQDFVDVFSAEQDAKDGRAWMQFVPHEQMLDLLVALLDTLERKTPKPVWMHGQYGTGKTMCLFVLKHLLEDPMAEVERYFGWYKELGTDLLKRVRALRQRGPGLVVYLSSSGHIDSNLKFMATLQRAIQERLEERGMQATSGALIDQVLERIDGSTLNWSALFAQHRGEFLGLATSAEDVIAQLRHASAEDSAPLDLLAAVDRCLQSFGMVVSDSAEDVKAWLQEVIAANDLQYLVCMWDEFTEFFTHNAGLDGLQELAHLSAQSPFYLMLATHREPRQLEGGRRESWRKIGDRFKTLPYMMEPVTATRLMGGVMQARAGQAETWDARRKELFAAVEPHMLPLLRGSEKQRMGDYRQIVPLHPYAAFLLSTISQNFSSANRTVFRFMRASDEHGLPRFLAAYPQDDWNWYTADGLWDYFFETTNPDTPQAFRDVISYYGSRAEQVDDAALLRAFKATLLLIGLEKAIGDPRVVANLHNLTMLFTGTPLRFRMDQVMDALSEQRLINRVGVGRGQNVTYTIAQTNMDTRQLDALRKKAPTFRAMFSPRGEITSAVNKSIERFPARLQQRMRAEIVPLEDLRGRRDGVVPATRQPYRIPSVMVLCEKADEVVSARTIIADLSRERTDVLWLLCEDPFGAERMAAYREDWANREYYRANKDPRNERYHNDRMKTAMREWTSSLAGVRITAWSDGSLRQVSGTMGIRQALDTLIEARFPYRPDTILATDPLFQDSRWGQSGAEIGLGIKNRGNPYNQVMDRIHDLVPGQGPLDDDKLAAQPDHPVTRMRAAIAPLVARDGFQIRDAWRTLQKAPFGVPPSPMGILLMGLMLRDCREGYYWNDHGASHALDGTRLAELINDTLHEKGDATLQKSSLEERQLCKLLVETYNLSGTEVRYLDGARSALRAHIARLGYPLWTLNHYLQELGRRSVPSLKDLDELLVAEPLEGTFTQERIKSMMRRMSADRNALRTLNELNCYQQGMMRFMHKSDTRLNTVNQALGLTPTSLMSRLRATLPQEVALWREQDVADALPALVEQLDLVSALADLTGESVTDMAEACKAVARLIQPGKLPLGVLGEQDDSGLAETLDELSSACTLRNNYGQPQLLADLIRQRRDDILAAIDDPVGAIRRWSAHRLNLALSPEDAASLWDVLPDMSAADENNVPRTVRRLAENLAKTKVVAELQTAWNETTGTASPDAWSDAHHTPIAWLVDAPPQERGLDTLRNPERASAAEIKQAAPSVRALGKRLAAMTPAQIDARFAQIAADSSAPLIQAPQELAALRDYLRKALGEPSGWKQLPVRQETARWIATQYRARYLPRVLSEIETLPQQEAKDLLSKLAHDPKVGVAFLTRGRGHEN